MKHRPILSLVVLFLFSTAAFCTTPPEGTAEYIQKQLNSQEISGSGVNGDKAIGGITSLPAGHLEWSTGVRFSSGQTIEGQEAATLVIFSGPPGTAAFEIFANAGNGSVSEPRLRNLQIICTNGGDAVRVDQKTTKTVKKFLMENITIRNGGIKMPGEHFNCMFRNVTVFDPKTQALRLDGFTNVLSSFHVFGTPGSHTVPVVELHGSATLTNYCWIELWDGFALRLSELVAENGYHHPGNFDSTSIHLEAQFLSQKRVKFVESINSFFRGHSYGGVPSWPWYVDATSTVKLEQPINAGSFYGPGKVIAPEQPAK